MKSLNRLFLVAAACAALVACDEDGEKAADKDSPVVAVVNGDAIHQSDVDAYYAQLPENYRAVPLEFIEAQLIERLIERKLMLKAAEKDGMDDDPRYKAQVAEMREIILQDLWIKDKVAARLTEEHLRGVYDDAVAQFTPEREIKARHILVDTEDEATAVIASVESGADFSELAKKLSTDEGSGANGGDLGYFTAEQMVPPFSEAAFATEVGSYTAEPVKSQFGWHVIMVDDVRMTAPPTYDEVKTALREDEERKLYGKIVDELLASATIERMTETPETDLPEGDMPPAGDIEGTGAGDIDEEALPAPDETGGTDGSEDAGAMPEDAPAPEGTAPEMPEENPAAEEAVTP